MTCARLGHTEDILGHMDLLLLVGHTEDTCWLVLAVAG